MTRGEILDSVEANVENSNLVKHMLATEAIMRALARRFGEDEEEWGLTGLLHDIDVELTEDDPTAHSTLGADLARELGASDQMCHAILCHDEAHGIPCETLLDKALFCSNPLTRLIVASALVHPDQKLPILSPDSIMKRFNERRFATGANGEQIALCKDIGLDLEEFIALGLEAMKSVADELEL